MNVEKEKRELVKKLVERRYGPFSGAGGAGRILFEGSLREQTIEVLRSMEKFAAEQESEKTRRDLDARAKRSLERRTEP